MLLAIDNPFAPLGVDSWTPIINYGVAFLVFAFLLNKFAFKPVLKILDERKERIEQGEEMHRQAKLSLSSTEQRTRELLDQANENAGKIIAEAKQAASEFLEQQKQVAANTAEDIVEKARQAAEIQSRKDREELEARFLDIVAKATANVAGKVLNDDDKRHINNQAVEQFLNN